MAADTDEKRVQLAKSVGIAEQLVAEIDRGEMLH